jgi:hypothetical protein
LTAGAFAAGATATPLAAASDLLIGPGCVLLRAAARMLCVSTGADGAASFLGGAAFAAAGFAAGAAAFADPPPSPSAAGAAGLAGAPPFASAFRAAANISATDILLLSTIVVPGQSRTIH